MSPGTNEPKTEAAETTRFVCSVFETWRGQGIGFLVLRNYENLPESTTNDIDVLVAPGNLAIAERLLRERASATGFRLHNRAQFATLACYFSSKDSTAQAHFDLFTDLKWRSFDFLGCKDFLRDRVRYKEFFIPRPGHEAATNLLATMIYTGKVKEKYKPSITKGFREDEAPASSLLAKTYGRSLAAQMIAAGKAQDWVALESLTPALRRALVFRQTAGKPLRTLSSLCSDARRGLGRLLRPPGLMVVICGPDGSGKSTVARLLQEGLAPSFSPVKSRQYHWKVPVITGNRMAERGPTTAPHAQPPRNPLLSVLFFCVHWFEFVVGPRLGLGRTLFTGGLVLIDRYYYDFFVDPKRYRLNVPQWLVRAGYLFVKKPGLVLLLDAPAVVLQQRKQEVSLEETARQRTAFVELIGSLPQGRILDAAKPAELVAVEAQKAILDFLAVRTRQWHIGHDVRSASEKPAP